MSSENQYKNAVIVRNTTLILTNVAIILGGVACASEQQPISTPTTTKTAETALPGTVTTAPTLAETQLPTFIPTESPTPEATKTLEVSFNLTLNPENASNMSIITSFEEIPQHANWVKNRPECSLLPATKTMFSAADRDGSTALNSNKNDGSYEQARNSKLCDVAKLSPGFLGLPADPMFLISQPTEDNRGNKATFQFAIGGRGLNEMIKNQFFTNPDRYPPRLIPIDRITKDEQSRYFSGFGVDIDLFYTSQGTSSEEVANFFRKVATQNELRPEDIQFAENHVFIGIPVYPMTSD